jgi:hypothetical protein
MVPTGRLYDVFPRGTYDRIAVFGPESARAKQFFADCGIAAHNIAVILNERDVETLQSGIPLVMLPLWWKSEAAPVVVNAARGSGCEILTAFPT